MPGFRCLVLDHDDTAVKSTPVIHFPAFQDTLRALRPGLEMSLEEFMGYCFEPGFSRLCGEVLGFTTEEMAYQLENWQRHVDCRIPEFYEGIPEILESQKAAGGLICVVSHSRGENIYRDYQVRLGIRPALVFGWELGEEKRKPSPYPLLKIMETYSLRPEELLVVDDLKPGCDMARARGVKSACAGWSGQLPAAAEFMKARCDYYFDQVEELRQFLFGPF